MSKLKKIQNEELENVNGGVNIDGEGYWYLYCLDCKEDVDCTGYTTYEGVKRAYQKYESHPHLGVGRKDYTNHQVKPVHRKESY